MCVCVCVRACVWNVIHVEGKTSRAAPQCQGSGGESLNVCLSMDVINMYIHTVTPT